MFKLPTGYQCIVPAYSSAQNSLYAYNSRSRDTYDLIGTDWVRTRRLTYSYDQDLSGFDCLSMDKLVPTDITFMLVLPATILVICFFNLILKMFMGVRR